MRQVARAMNTSVKELSGKGQPSTEKRSESDNHSEQFFLVGRYWLMRQLRALNQLQVLRLLFRSIVSPKRAAASFRFASSRFHLKVKFSLF